MTVRRYIAACILVEVLLVGAVLSPGCMSAAKVQETAQLAGEAESALDVIKGELAGLKEDLANLNPEDPDAQETADKLVTFINDKTAEAEKWMGVLQDATGKLAKVEDGYGLAELIATGVASFFPPAAVAVPIIRRSRRMFEGVVSSVAAGGGPKDSQAVRDAMAHYPGLKDYVTSVRVKIGDKELKAVSTKDG